MMLGSILSLHPEWRILPARFDKSDQEWFAYCVQGFSYKPGWTFTPVCTDDGRCFLDIEWEEPNTNNPDEIIKLSWRETVCDGDMVTTRYGFRDWITNCISKAEVHERMEWMKLHGERLWDVLHVGG